MSNKIMTDEEISKRSNEIIDNLIKTGKETVKDLVALFIKKIGQTSEEKFDDSVIHLKKKIKERLNKYDQKQEAKQEG